MTKLLFDATQGGRCAKSTDRASVLVLTDPPMRFRKSDVLPEDFDFDRQAVDRSAMPDRTSDFSAQVPSPSCTRGHSVAPRTFVGRTANSVGPDAPRAPSVARPNLLLPNYFRDPSLGTRCSITFFTRLDGPRPLPLGPHHSPPYMSSTYR